MFNKVSTKRNPRFPLDVRGPRNSFQCTGGVAWEFIALWLFQLKSSKKTPTHHLLGAKQQADTPNWLTGEHGGTFRGLVETKDRAKRATAALTLTKNLTHESKKKVYNVAEAFDLFVHFLCLITVIKVIIKMAIAKYIVVWICIFSYINHAFMRFIR